MDDVMSIIELKCIHINQLSNMVRIGKQHIKHVKVGDGHL